MTTAPTTTAKPRRGWFQYRLRTLLVLMLTRVGWSAAGPQTEPVPNELPRSWSLEEIAAETPPFGMEGRVYVLASKVEEDGQSVIAQDPMEFWWWTEEV